MYNFLNNYQEATMLFNFSVKDGFLKSAVIGARLDNWRNNTDFKVTIKFKDLKVT
jgi:hypothetical protein